MEDLAGYTDGGEVYELHLKRSVQVNDHRALQHKRRSGSKASTISHEPWIKSSMTFQSMTVGVATPVTALALLSSSSPQLDARTSLSTVRSSSLDCALAPGFGYGCVNGISGPPSSGKSLIALELLVSHLLGGERYKTSSESQSLGVLIDTTGGGGALVRRLRDAIRRRGIQEDGLLRRLLDRVLVIRVFDFDGFTDALLEVEGLAVTRREEQVDRREEIADSEGEDDETDDERAEVMDLQSPEGMSQKIGMLIVDNITNITSAMTSKDHIQGTSTDRPRSRSHLWLGHAALHSSMRSLASLTSRHHICTLVLNGVVSNHADQSSIFTKRPADNVSIFASTAGRPALGKSFLSCVDFHVHLSQVPNARADAETAYGGEMGKSWDEMSVCEVISDRFGSRTGRWGCFAIVSRIDVIVKGWKLILDRLPASFELLDG